MDYLKGSTAKGKRVIAMYNRNEGYYLDDVYGRSSVGKNRAWRQCMDWFNEDNEASNFHICSHSCQNFTVGWAYIDAETGHRIIRVETSSNTYKVDTEV